MSMSSLLPLSGAADRTGCFLLPLEPLLWLADCTLSDTRPGLSPVSFWRIWLSLAVNTAESHVGMFGYRYRRPATYLQSVTTGCFWTVSYTVILFVQVLAGQTSKVRVTSGVTVQSFTMDRNVLRRNVHGHILFLASLHAAVFLQHVCLVSRSVWRGGGGVDREGGWGARRLD